MKLEIQCLRFSSQGGKREIETQEVIESGWWGKVS